MRVGPALLCLMASVSAQPPATLDGDSRAFVEVVSPANSYFVQQRFRLKLRFGFEPGFLKSNLLQLFRRRLDVPAQVDASWILSLPGADLFEDPRSDLSGSRDRRSCALNGKMVDVLQLDDAVRGGRRFAVFEIETTWLAHHVGELVIEGPRLRFAFATRFKDDFINGRVAEDRRDVSLQGKPLALEILPLPGRGKPPGFIDAVGSFSVRAEAVPREVAVGKSFKLKLHILGQGNLSVLTPPRLDTWKDFHVYGKVEEKSAGQRTVTFDLAPLHQRVKEVPTISLAFFDPAPPAGYHTVQTRTIPLVVTPAPGDSSLPATPGSTLRMASGTGDLFDLKPVMTGLDREGPRPLSAPMVLATLLAPWVLFVGILSWRRTRHRSYPDVWRARRAAAEFHSRLGEVGSDPSHALAEYLAARLTCSVPAVIGKGLADKLVAAGVPIDLAGRTEALFEDLVAVRFGGDAPDGGAEMAAQLVAALEVAFGPVEDGS